MCSRAHFQIFLRKMPISKSLQPCTVKYRYMQLCLIFYDYTCTQVHVHVHGSFWLCTCIIRHIHVYTCMYYALDYHMTGFSAHMTGFLDVYVEDVGVANDDNEQGGPSDADPLLGRFSSMRDFFPFVIPPHNSSEIKKKSEKKECQFDPKVIHNVQCTCMHMQHVHLYACTCIYMYIQCTLYMYTCAFTYTLYRYIYTQCTCTIM